MFIKDLLKATDNPLFYCLSFKPGSLRYDTIWRGCAPLPLPLDGYRFVRKTLFAFELQYNGANTYLNYFIDENTID